MLFVQHAKHGSHSSISTGERRRKSVVQQNVPATLHPVQSSETTSLLSPLVGLVLDPLGAIGNLSERLWDGFTSEEKKRAWKVERRKESLQAQLANVGLARAIRLSVLIVW